jgi:hypothetical protein
LPSSSSPRCSDLTGPPATRPRRSRQPPSSAGSSARSRFEGIRNGFCRSSPRREAPSTGRFRHLPP